MPFDTPAGPWFRREKPGVHTEAFSAIRLQTDLSDKFNYSHYNTSYTSASCIVSRKRAKNIEKFGKM